MEEVSETNVQGPENVVMSLRAAIDSGQILAPDLMEFNQWQQWRRVDGRRPQMAVDGNGTTSAFESRLWRRTMRYVHGEGWEQALARERALIEAASRELVAQSQAAADGQQSAAAPAAPSVCPLYAP